MRSLGKSVVLTVVFLCTPLFAAEEPLSVREDRPRIMLTPSRIEALKDKLSSEPIPGRDAGKQALTYVLTGDREAGAAAVRYMLDFDVSDEVLEKKTASDPYRWSSFVPVIYDWCYDLLSDEERSAFEARYGRIAAAMNAKSWGGPHMPGNNYYAGYMRNSAIFGLAAFGRTPLAQAALDDALITRWRESTLPFYASAAKGGVIGEGSQYDRYNSGYVMWLAEALKSATGRDLYRETNWFREFVFETIYSTTPAPARIASLPEVDSYYQRFPFGDCEMWRGHPATDEYTGDSMRALALAYADEPVGAYAKAWLDMVEPAKDVFGWLVEDGREVEAGQLKDLPLDYFAPGAGYAWARSGWGAGATAVMLQLGIPQKGSHEHLDAGSFQIVRAGSWMTKESTGYSTQFNGCTSRDAMAHNTVLINGRCQANAYLDGAPEILAVETARDFFHAAVDLSKACRASTSSHPDRDDNPECVRIIREFLYIRPDVLVVFDRLESVTDEAEKTYVVHLPLEPKREDDENFGTLFTTETGGSQVVFQTVYPPDVAYKIVDEGAVDGRKSDAGFYQWRLEATKPQGKKAYFMTVLAAQERFDLAPKCTLVEKDETIGMVVSQPGRRFEVHFAKEPGESFGNLVIDAAGAYGHSESSLPAKVQGIAVDASGVKWGAPVE